jgi:unsaturated chondroitin disaccharide hydrolase
MQKFDKKSLISEKEIKEALEQGIYIVEQNLPEFTDRFQITSSVNQFYKPEENKDWTAGFWTGEIWMAYDNTQNETFRKAAEVQVDSFHERISTKRDVDHHDMGFLYTPSCVAGYKLTGSSKAKEAAILAADQLAGRFQEKGGFIQAWGGMDDPGSYRFIIDCLLNLPLLYWATEVTGNQMYRKIAEIHTDTALKNLIREDYSTWHTFYFDFTTGKPSHGRTCQGYRDGSAWARGQAWGVYGIALSYGYTKKKEYIDMFKNVTDFFLSKLPDDLVPFWDLEFTDGDDQPRDSSSAAIVVCGILEMIKYLDEQDALKYKTMVLKIMKSLIDNYSVKDTKISNGLLLHGTYSNPSPYNTCHCQGVDECNTWGDYFYLEALTRLSKDWKSFW